jgi:3-deoxy-D-manno-octulosonate 8-phosphate phosphatase (KDO 8-P phosphatase)
MKELFLGMSYYSITEQSLEAKERAMAVKIILSDNDGVLTDACVYYSQNGEELKRYNMRDGMGFDRLRKLAKLPCGIVTKEKTDFSIRRSEKLSLEFIRVAVEDKVEVIDQLLEEQGFHWQDLAYIGDDVNDLPVLKKAGFSACPGDALPSVSEACHIQTEPFGGCGAFRAFAEFILKSKSLS